MPWSNASTLGADELSALAADLPLIVPNNILRTSTVEPEWRRDASSPSWTSATADQTVSGSPGRLTYDDKGNSQTQSETTGLGSGTLGALIYNLAPSSTDAGQVDTIAIINHNFAALGSALSQVDVQVSTLNTFANVGVDTWTIATWSSFDTQRLVSFTVSDGASSPRRLHTIQYVRILFTYASAPSVGPAIGEVVMGRRYQFGSKADLPFPEYMYSSLHSDIEMEDGTRSRTKLHGGRFAASHKWTLGGMRYPGIDRVANAKSIIDESDDFARTVLYCEAPSTYPRSTYLVSADSEGVTQHGPLHHEITIQMAEQPPFLKSEL